MNDYLANAKAMNEQIEPYDTIIVGLGKTGMSCVRHLQSQGQTNFAVMDSRTRPPGLAEMHESYPQIPMYLGEFNTQQLCAAGRVILSPGISLKESAIQEALKSDVPVYGDIELFCRQVNKPIVAVTGSNGKSTVATLLSDMIVEADLQVALGGNIGVPVLDLLELAEPDFYVLELSSFQLELVNSLNSIVSVILNISPDHMDRYADLNSYAAAKQRIYQGSGTVIINQDDEISSQWQRSQNRTYINYGLEKPEGDSFGLASINGERCLMQGQQQLIAERELRIRGDHNLSNALAALALGTAIDLPVQAMADGLRKFTGLAHRCQFVASTDGIDWYNDSKGTNVGASCAAIEGLSNRENIILIAGGDSKGADFTPLLKSVQGRVRAAVLIGKDAKRLAAAFDGFIPVCFATSMQAAVNAAAELAANDDLVLLSPACASLDMFKDFQERGEVFIKAVRSLTEQGGDI